MVRIQVTGVAMHSKFTFSCHFSFVTLLSIDKTLRLHCSDITKCKLNCFLYTCIYTSIQPTQNAECPWHIQMNLEERWVEKEQDSLLQALHHPVSQSPSMIEANKWHQTLPPIYLWPTVKSISFPPEMQFSPRNPPTIHPRLIEVF